MPMFETLSIGMMQLILYHQTREFIYLFLAVAMNVLTLVGMGIELFK